MQFDLKKLSQAGLAEANAKAERYRFLNQPDEAESICLDVLAAEPENQIALRNLGLSLTDQFSGKSIDRYTDAEKAFQQLKDTYERLYYTGILHERRGKSQLRAGQMPHALLVVFEEAMRCFAQAEALSPKGNDNAILHWNMCARFLQSRGDTEWNRGLGGEREEFDAGDSTPVSTGRKH